MIFFFCYNIFAESDKHKLPRFAMTKANIINARTGPGMRYPTEWVLMRKYEPIEILKEFEQWRYIRDISGEVGWVHSSVLSGKRGVIVIGSDIVNLFRSDNPKSRIVAKLEPGVRCALKKYEKYWCKVQCDNYTGWIFRKYLWGISAYE